MCGEWDVNKLMSSIPIDLFCYWLVYLENKKYVHDKKDYALAQLSAVVANSFSSGETKYTADDFLIRFDRPYVENSDNGKVEISAKEQQNLDILFAKLGVVERQQNSKVGK